MTAPVVTHLALGSNLGDRLAHLRAAVAALAALPDHRVLAVSACYETAPLGPPGQQPYLNAALALETPLAPRDLLDACLAIERARGRERRERWGPRTLDIDILFYGDLAINDDRLAIPHPALHERAFVLAPLCDLCPDRDHRGQTLAARLAGLDRSGVRRLDAPL